MKGLVEKLLAVFLVIHVTKKVMDLISWGISMFLLLIFFAIVMFILLIS